MSLYVRRSSPSLDGIVAVVPSQNPDRRDRRPFGVTSTMNILRPVPVIIRSPSQHGVEFGGVDQCTTSSDAIHESARYVAGSFSDCSSSAILRRMAFSGSTQSKELGKFEVECPEVRRGCCGLRAGSARSVNLVGTPRSAKTLATSSRRSSPDKLSHPRNTLSTKFCAFGSNFGQLFHASSPRNLPRTCRRNLISNATV